MMEMSVMTNKANDHQRPGPRPEVEKKDNQITAAIAMVIKAAVLCSMGIVVQLLLLGVMCCTRHEPVYLLVCFTCTLFLSHF